MPEAPVNEDGKLRFRENKIWSTYKLGASSPPADFIEPEQRNKPQLRSLISLTLDQGHDRRPFGRCKDIWHAS
jgi:hypothetical protein